MKKNVATTVFVSYSHKDKVWLERLKVHLSPLRRDFDFDIWEDTQLRPGKKSLVEITSALNAANVAIFLVSADFLDSEFIRDNELPLLLDAADQRGVTILPVILSPCLYRHIPMLSEYQAVNLLTQPVIGMDKCQQEQTFADLAEQVLLRKRVVADTVAQDGSPSPREEFTNLECWKDLVKIGDWKYDRERSQISGNRPFRYLLSRNDYGPGLFSIAATVQIGSGPQSKDKSAFNAGIVLGWKNLNPYPQYYHLLMTGKRLLLEAIGLNGGPPHEDWTHLDDGIELPPKSEPFSIRLTAGQGAVEVHVDEKYSYRVVVPPTLSGRVGLRAWRASPNCSKFEVALGG